MPSYDFTCLEEHMTTWFGRWDERPSCIPCEACGAEAKRSWSRKPKADPAKEGGKVKWRGSPPRMAAHEFKCMGCDHDDLVIVDFEEGETTDPRPCEQDGCEGAMYVQYSTRIDRMSERFPYFDRGLNCWVTSRQDRLDKAAARGLVPLDGDIDLDAITRRGRQEDQAEEAELARVDDMYENHPAYRQYRELRDKGAFGEGDSADDEQETFTLQAG